MYTMYVRYTSSTGRSARGRVDAGYLHVYVYRYVLYRTWYNYTWYLVEGNYIYHLRVLRLVNARRGESVTNGIWLYGGGDLFLRAASVRKPPPLWAYIIVINIIQ